MAKTLRGIVNPFFHGFLESLGWHMVMPEQHMSELWSQISAAALRSVWDKARDHPLTASHKGQCLGFCNNGSVTSALLLQGE